MLIQAVADMNICIAALALMDGIVGIRFRLSTGNILPPVGIMECHHSIGASHRSH